MKAVGALICVVVVAAGTAGGNRGPSNPASSAIGLSSTVPSSTVPSSTVPSSTVPGRWALPVNRQVIDRFRPPRTAYGAGNRGWEFGTSSGDPVVAPGDGVVVFAGPVAGRRVLVLAHPGGVTSALTGMARIGVAVGQWVHAGQPVGTARANLHLGFRRDDTYLDPALFLGGLRRHAVLVAVPAGAGPR